MSLLRINEQTILAAAQSDAEFDGHKWIGMPRTARDRYLERSRLALEAAAKASEEYQTD